MLLTNSLLLSSFFRPCTPKYLVPPPIFLFLARYKLARLCVSFPFSCGCPALLLYLRYSLASLFDPICSCWKASSETYILQEMRFFSLRLLASLSLGLGVPVKEYDSRAIVVPVALALILVCGEYFLAYIYKRRYPIVAHFARQTKQI